MYTQAPPSKYPTTWSSVLQFLTVWPAKHVKLHGVGAGVGAGTGVGLGVGVGVVHIWSLTHPSAESQIWQAPQDGGACLTQLYDPDTSSHASGKHLSAEQILVHFAVQSGETPEIVQSAAFKLFLIKSRPLLSFGVRSAWRLGVLAVKLF